MLYILQLITVVKASVKVSTKSVQLCIIKDTVSLRSQFHGTRNLATVHEMDFGMPCMYSKYGLHYIALSYFVGYFTKFGKIYTPPPYGY